MKHSCVFVLVLLLLSSVVTSQPNGERVVGSIDFFGYKSFDLAPIRSALPLHERDTFPGARSTNEWKRVIRESIQRATGREPTDVNLVCCDGQKNWMIYIGLPGKTSVPLDYNPAPRGEARLPTELVTLDEEIRVERVANIMGNNRAKEDDARGYALSYEPTLRAKQLALREYSVRNETLLLDVLDTSSETRHRAIAATALGYAAYSTEQVTGLIKANLDADSEVRNNAVRALGVLMLAKPELARQIPATAFIKLLVSPTWTDHNKGVFVLGILSKERNEALLKRLRLEALDNLLEMAQWQYVGHAYDARMILGRIAGIEEGRLSELAIADPAAIFGAL